MYVLLVVLAGKGGRLRIKYWLRQGQMSNYCLKQEMRMIYSTHFQIESLTLSKLCSLRSEMSGRPFWKAKISSSLLRMFSTWVPITSIPVLHSSKRFGELKICLGTFLRPSSYLVGPWFCRWKVLRLPEYSTWLWLGLDGWKVLSWLDWSDWFWWSFGYPECCVFSVNASKWLSLVRYSFGGYDFGALSLGWYSYGWDSFWRFSLGWKTFGWYSCDVPWLQKSQSAPLQLCNIKIKFRQSYSTKSPSIYYILEFVVDFFAQKIGPKAYLLPWVHALALLAWGLYVLTHHCVFTS